MLLIMTLSYLKGTYYYTIIKQANQAKCYSDTIVLAHFPCLTNHRPTRAFTVMAD